MSIKQMVVTNKDFIDCFEIIKNLPKQSEVFTLILSTKELKVFTKEFGDNCGYDRNKVRIIERK